ncbi:MAG: hypothetical protein U1E87_01270 [Alphaproteobacteria bacterium]
MLKAFLHSRIRGLERKFNYDAGYLHEVLDTSLDAFRRFAAFTQMSQYTAGAPKEARFAAQLAATLTEDCGPCTQIVVNIALAAGVKGEILTALLARDFQSAGDTPAFGFRFGEALARNLPEVTELGEEAERRFGKRGRLALTYAAAAARVYPAVKRGLGLAKECTRIKVGSDEVWVKHAA